MSLEHNFISVSLSLVFECYSAWGQFPPSLSGAMGLPPVQYLWDFGVDKVTLLEVSDLPFLGATSWTIVKFFFYCRQGQKFAFSLHQLVVPLHIIIPPMPRVLGCH